MGSRALLERLLHVREIEEEQRRLVLEAALAALAELQQARTAAGERERAGRRLVAVSANTGEIVDRVAGMEESRSAIRRIEALGPRIAAAETAVATLRKQYLEKRTSRRQAETLVEQQKAREAADELRRGQRAMDDWYLNRMLTEGERK